MEFWRAIGSCVSALETAPGSGVFLSPNIYIVYFYYANNIVALPSISAQLACKCLDAEEDRVLI